MLRHEVLDSFLLSQAADAGATLVPGLVTSLSLPTGPTDPYLVHYISSGGDGPSPTRSVLEVDAVTEAGIRRGYLRRWDDEFLLTFRFLDLLQRVFYGNNAGGEALVEMCADEHVQRRTFDCYLHKRMAPGEPWADLQLLWRTAGSMVRCSVLGKEVQRLAVATPEKRRSGIANENEVRAR